MAVDTTYSYDKADRIQQTQVAGAVPVNYTVNANGNETARGADTFTYDQANPLTSVGLAGVQTFQHGYDGDGKRVNSSIVGIVGTANDTNDVAGRLPLLLDDGSRKYVWGLGELYNVDKTTAKAQVYHTDGLGSVRAITDDTTPNALVIQTYRTDEFGIPDPSGTMGASTQPLQYTGEQRDAESNFMYLRARVHDPRIGRFMQADPLRKSGPSTGGWNRYSYVGNSPTNHTDPSGRDYACRARVDAQYIGGARIGGTGSQVCSGDILTQTMWVDLWSCARLVNTVCEGAKPVERLGRCDRFGAGDLVCPDPTPAPMDSSGDGSNRAYTSFAQRTVGAIIPTPHR